MQVSAPASPPRTAAAPALTPVNLARLSARQLARLLLGPPPQLLVDCGNLLMPHPLGVGRFVAQLLLLRQRGSRIWLCNVHPGLRRCLYQMKLGALLSFSK